MVHLLLLLLTACAPPRGAEDSTDWYDSGMVYTPLEPVAFTTDAYGLPAAGEPGIADSLYPAVPVANGGAVAQSEVPGGSPCAGWQVTDQLPVEITGVVTILPQFYFKSSGCSGDEKFYTSWFIEDDTGGMLVLGNSRAAAFDAGDVVTLSVRSVQYSFENRIIYGHDVLDVQRVGRPIRYEDANRPFISADIGRVRRVTGTVVQEPDGFGTFYVHPDGQEAPCIPPADNDADPVGCAALALSTELNRRPVEIPAGTRLRATGPVAQSFDYKLIITRLGQIERLEETSEP